MIFDHVTNRSRYALGTRLETALRFFADHLSDDLEDGEIVLIPDEVIAHVMEKTTTEDPMMEIHRKWIDVHCILSGAEQCGFGKTPISVDYDPQTDNGFFAMDSESSILAQAGCFYIVWPEEAHKPLCNPDTEVNLVKKIVFKVLPDA